MRFSREGFRYIVKGYKTPRQKSRRASKVNRIGRNLEPVRKCFARREYISDEFAITFYILTGIWLGSKREKPTKEELAERLDFLRKERYKSRSRAKMGLDTQPNHQSQ